jgi:hypothetical protein
MGSISWTGRRDSEVYKGMRTDYHNWRCKICGHYLNYGDNPIYHITDHHIGDFLAFVENEYMAKLFKNAIRRSYDII